MVLHDAASVCLATKMHSMCKDEDMQLKDLRREFIRHIIVMNMIQGEYTALFPALNQEEISMLKGYDYDITKENDRYIVSWEDKWTFNNSENSSENAKTKSV